MKKILDILKYKFGWQTYKDAFFWTFISIWLFVDVVTFSCIYDNPNIDWEWTMHFINLGFICFIAICTFIKERGGKFNDWLNTKFDKQNNMKTDNICDRCKKPMDTTIAEMHAITYGQNFYACEHCGMLYSLYRPEIVIYKPLGYWEEKAEDDWGKEVIADSEYKKKFPLYIPPRYRK